MNNQLNDTAIFNELDSMEVGQKSTFKLSVIGSAGQLRVITHSWTTVAENENVKVSNDDVITFSRNGKKYKGYLSVVWSNFNFKRIK